MKKVLIPVFILFILTLNACSTSQKVIIPLDSSLPLDDTYTIIWNGISKAYRFENGQWLRAESFDYQFDVIQKRYEKHWKSVKSLHRIHPDYNGKAGNRDQTMYFEVVYQQLNAGKVQAVIQSSLGKGKGISDSEFRETTINISLDDASAFMPYNKIKINQHYNYEKGILTETVELVKEKDGKEIPFMKNEETASIYLKGKLDKAPSVFQ